jgi:hypothetical protein
MTTGGSGGISNGTDKRLVLVDKQKLAALRDELRHPNNGLHRFQVVLDELLTAIIGD